MIVYRFLDRLEISTLFWRWACSTGISAPTLLLAVSNGSVQITYWNISSAGIIYCQFQSGSVQYYHQYCGFLGPDDLVTMWTEQLIYCCWDFIWTRPPGGGGGGIRALPIFYGCLPLIEHTIKVHLRIVCNEYWQWISIYKLCLLYLSLNCETGINCDLSTSAQLSEENVFTKICNTNTNIHLLPIKTLLL